MARLQINSGDKFGRLSIIEEGSSRSGKRMVICKCDCGKIKEYQLSNLTTGHTKSCGCYNIDALKKNKTIHGLSSHPLRKVYDQMKSRCKKSFDKSFCNYGARGISVCNEWDKSYIAFYNWAIANGWKKGLSIERKNNDCGYKPNNCIFADKYEQANNTRKNVYLFVDGIKYSISQYSRRFDIGIKYIKNRIKKGMSGDMILVDYGLR